jgi:hypothetical protein
MKIYYRHHGNSNKKRPYIRLCGDYLSKMDFKIGDTIELIIESGQISITKLPKE